MAREYDVDDKRRKNDLEFQIKSQALIVTFMKTMQRLDPDWKSDTRLLAQTKERLQNIVLGNARPTNASYNRPINIAEVARGLGIDKLSRRKLHDVNEKAVSLYRAKHHKEPEKRSRIVNGTERLVNVYAEADREIIRTAISDVLKI